MRVLVTSDIHANWEALQAVAAAAGSCDACICLGDVVGYGASPNETAAWIQAHSAAVVRGNHDRAGAGLTGLEGFHTAAAAAARWTQSQLGPENATWLRALPAGPREWQGLTLAHGSSRDEDEYVLDAAAARAVFQATASPVQWFGHTHVQGGFALQASGVLPVEGASGEALSSTPGGMSRRTLRLRDGVRYLLNPGAVGQPRDGDWRAAFAVLDPDKGVVDFCRVPYAVARAQARIRAAGLPPQLARRLSAGR